MKKQSILVLMMYGSLSISMDSDGEKLFMGVKFRNYSSLKNSFLREYCNNNPTQDCLFIRDHLQKANDHKTKRNRIRIYGYYMDDLLKVSSEPIVTEPVIKKLEEKKQKYPNWNRDYWDTL